MRGGLGQSEERGAAAVLPTVAPASVKEIPYDYVATFPLEGNSGHLVQDVINISTEGAFVAVSIGYSFLPVEESPHPPR